MNTESWITELRNGISRVVYTQGSSIRLQGETLYIGIDTQDILRLVTAIGAAQDESPPTWRALVLWSYTGWSLIHDRLGEERTRYLLRAGGTFFIIRYSVPHVLMAAGMSLALSERGVEHHKVEQLLRQTGINLDGVSSVDQLCSVLEELFPPDVLNSDSLRRFINR